MKIDEIILQFEKDLKSLDCQEPLKKQEELGVIDKNIYIVGAGNILP